VFGLKWGGFLSIQKNLLTKGTDDRFNHWRELWIWRRNGP
jgi:hypothetical protein